MRKIKFRGQRVDSGKWVYGYYIYNEHEGICKHIIITNWAQVYTNCFEVVPETVGQYTGLKDWYAGDIIQKGNLILPIVQECGENGLRFMLGKRPLLKCDAEHGCKIGNIHDNPELLKG